TASGAAAMAGAGMVFSMNCATGTGRAAWHPAVHDGAGPKPLCTQSPWPLITTWPLELVTSPCSFISCALAVAEKAPSARAQARASVACVLVKGFLMVFFR